MILAAGLALLLSCTQTPARPEEMELAKIELSAQTQALFDQGVRLGASENLEATLQFSTNKPWTIAVEATRAVSWIRVSSYNGMAGDAHVQLAVEPNLSQEARRATLSLYCDQQKTQMTISQEAAPAVVPDPVAVQRVTLSPASLRLPVRGEAELSYAVYPGNADVESVSWTTSDAAVVTVADGQLTAVGAGSAVVTVKVNEVEARCSVQVFIPAGYITLNHETYTLAPQETVQLAVTVFPEDAAMGRVVWTSSDPAVATVDQNGLVKGLQGGSAVIMAAMDELAPQRCRITVLSTASGNHEGTETKEWE